MRNKSEKFGTKSNLKKKNSFLFRFFQDLSDGQFEILKKENKLIKANGRHNKKEKRRREASNGANWAWRWQPQTTGRRVQEIKY